MKAFSSFSWQEYVSSPKVDSGINFIVMSCGLFFFILSIFSLILKKENIHLSKLLPLGAFCLFLMIVAQFVAKFFYIGVLLEHGIQIGAPIFLYFLIQSKLREKSFILLTKALIAATFIGHALFAIGFHPVPGHFIDMVVSILGVQEGAALRLLMIAGSLDILASFFLFFKKTEKYSLYFMVFWGGATALARMFAHVRFDFLIDSSHQWLFETIYRLPHALVPLALLFYMKEFYEGDALNA